MVRPWRVLFLASLVLLVSLGRSSEQWSSNEGRVPAGRNSTAITLRDDCPSSCGGVLVPYPFGLWENCSLPGFRLTCTSDFSLNRLLPGINAESILNISTFPPQARVMIGPSKLHANKSDSNNRWVDLSETPFTFNTTLNSFTGIGCDTLALLSNNVFGIDDYSAGCVSACTDTDGYKPTDNECSGRGCCRVSIPSGLSSYTTDLRHVNYINSNISKTEHIGFAFLIETSNYSFKTSDLERTLNSPWILQAALDWAIGNQTCREVNKTASYACQSRNSYCIDSVTGSGYFCSCTKGFRGNPYLIDGCEDIDECEKDPCYKDFPTARLPGYRYINQNCINLPGSYNCTCPQGSVQSDSICLIYQNSPNQNGNGSRVIIGVSCGSGGVGGLLLVIIAVSARRRFLKKRMQNRGQKLFKKNHDILLEKQRLYGMFGNIADRIRFFSLKSLEKATEKFDRSRIVGDGGHGTVYKGILDLQVVAIKKSKLDIRIEAEQFINEIVLLSQISHRNVVKLVGCCLEAEVPLLVYEFITNGTLFDHLHRSSGETSLTWNDRLRIATQISSALAYMHSAANVSIFHRDIKSSNILLDDKLTVKVSDFGASKTIDFDQTHVSTNIQGTFGYLDPEYVQTGQLTEKSDVYSLAVILVELLMGAKPSSKENSAVEGNTISHFIWAYKSNRLFDVLEPSITEDVNKEEVQTVAEVAMSCLSIRGQDRLTMKEVELRLEGLMKSKKK